MAAPKHGINSAGKRGQAGNGPGNVQNCGVGECGDNGKDSASCGHSGWHAKPAGCLAKPFLKLLLDFRIRHLLEQSQLKLLQDCSALTYESRNGRSYLFSSVCIKLRLHLVLQFLPD